MTQSTEIRSLTFAPTSGTLANPRFSRRIPACAAYSVSVGTECAEQFNSHMLTRHFQQDRRHVWVILVATEAGSRPRGRATPSRTPRPMQFRSVRDGSSALERTLRLARQIAPLEHIFAIATTEDEVWWHAPLSVLPKDNVLVQPENQGTAIRILLPLLHIYQCDPLAQVVLLPSERHVSDETVLAQALERAVRLLDRPDNEVLLLGIASQEGNSVRECIVSNAAGAIEFARVAKVVKKASLDEGLALLDRGALWNDFIVVARVRPLLNLFIAYDPDTVLRMRSAMKAAGRRSVARQPRNSTATCRASIPTMDSQSSVSHRSSGRTQQRRCAAAAESTTCLRSRSTG